MLKEMKCEDGCLRLSKVFKEYKGVFQWMYRLEIKGDFPKTKIIRIIGVLEKEIQ